LLKNELSEFFDGVVFARFEPVYGDAKLWGDLPKRFYAGLARTGL
jgi:hypothetical protein